METLEDYYGGPLVPACGGSETPFLVNGRMWLYCYHPTTGRHVYLDVDHDRAVWNRNFHPAFAPELEHEPDDMAPDLPSAGLLERTRIVIERSPHAW